MGADAGASDGGKRAVELLLDEPGSGVLNSEQSSSGAINDTGVTLGAKVTGLWMP